jgi:hypothetical protein
VSVAARSRGAALRGATRWLEPLLPAAAVAAVLGAWQWSGHYLNRRPRPPPPAHSWSPVAPSSSLSWNRFRRW